MAGLFPHVSNGNGQKQGKRVDMKSKPFKNSNGPAKPSPEPVLRDQIEKRAHEIWLAAGCPHGNDLSHWLQGESEVLKAYDDGSGRERRSTTA
jgi:hypothetical protein